MVAAEQRKVTEVANVQNWDPVSGCSVGHGPQSCRERPSFRHTPLAESAQLLLDDGDSDSDTGGDPVGEAAFATAALAEIHLGDLGRSRLGYM